jgi:hypothetical protein
VGKKRPPRKWAETCGNFEIDRRLPWYDTACPDHSMENLKIFRRNLKIFRRNLKIFRRNLKIFGRMVGNLLTSHGGHFLR